MTPEQEWIEAVLKRNREAAAFRDMLDADTRPVHRPAPDRWATLDVLIVLGVVVLVLVGVFHGAQTPVVTHAAASAPTAARAPGR